MLLWKHKRETSLKLNWKLVSLFSLTTEDVLEYRFSGIWLYFTFAVNHFIESWKLLLCCFMIKRGRYIDMNQPWLHICWQTSLFGQKGRSWKLVTNVSDLSEITHRFVTNTGKVIKSCLDSGGYVILRSLRHESFKTHFPLDGEGGKQHKKKKCQD